MAIRRYRRSYHWRLEARFIMSGWQSIFVYVRQAVVRRYVSWSTAVHELCRAGSVLVGVWASYRFINECVGWEMGTKDRQRYVRAIELRLLRWENTAEYYRSLPGGTHNGLRVRACACRGVLLSIWLLRRWANAVGMRSRWRDVPRRR